MLWTYDLRTGRRFSLRSDPLTDEALADFVARYGGSDRKDRRRGGPFQRFQIGDVLASDRCSLDLGLMAPSGPLELEPPGMIAAEIIDRLEAAADAIRAVEDLLGRR